MNTSSVPGRARDVVEDRRARADRFDHAHDDPAEERAGQARHPAEHRGGERGDEERDRRARRARTRRPRGSRAPRRCPPSSAAIAHTSVESRRTLMPISSVAVGSWLAPRIARPRLVLRKNSASSAASTTSTPSEQQALIRDLHAEHADPVERRQRTVERAGRRLAEPDLDRGGEQRDARRWRRAA